MLVLFMFSLLLFIAFGGKSSLSRILNHGDNHPEYSRSMPYFTTATHTANRSRIAIDHLLNPTINEPAVPILEPSTSEEVVVLDPPPPGPRPIRVATVPTPRISTTWLASEVFNETNIYYGTIPTATGMTSEFSRFAIRGTNVVVRDNRILVNGNQVITLSTSLIRVTRRVQGGPQELASVRITPTGVISKVNSASYITIVRFRRLDMECVDDTVSTITQVAFPICIAGGNFAFDNVNILQKIHQAYGVYKDLPKAMKEAYWKLNQWVICSII